MTPERCPDDLRLAAFVEGGVAAPEREGLETHVAGCATCLAVVATLLAPVSEGDRAGEWVPTSTAVAAPPRRGGGFRRWAVAAAVVVTAGGALFVAAQGRLASGAAGLAGRLLGVPFAAETVVVTGAADRSGLEVVLGQVSVGASERWHIRVDELRMTVALAAPLRGEPLLATLRAVRPVVVLPRAEDAPVSWGDGARVVRTVQHLGRVELVDARVELPVRGGSLIVSAINGEIRRTAAGRELALAGRVGRGDLAASGTVAPDGAMRLTIGGRALDASELPVLAGRVTGGALLRLDVRGDAANPRLDGRLALRDGRFLGVRPLWTMPLPGETRTMLGAVRPALAGEDLPFDELRARYAWRDGRWRLPQVYVQEDGFAAGGRAQVDRDGGLRGSGTVRIPEDVVTAVAPLAPALGAARDPAGTATVPFELSGRVTAPRLDLDRR